MWTNDKAAAPWPWGMVSYCLELPYGSVKHFPAGTYHEQVETWTGRIELSAMSTVQQAWYMFKHISQKEWKEPQLRFAKWMSEKPKQEPTRRLDGMIARLWRVSWWVILAMGTVRDD